MRVLYTTTVASTMGFFTSFVKELIDEGNIVDIATNEAASKVQDCYGQWGCRVHQMSWSRSPLSLGNIKAIFEKSKI